jgi:P2-related tail formation protein
MTIDNISMIDLIPPYMQDDITVIGLCAAADYIFKTLFSCIKKMDFYKNLDLLSDDDLDYMASTMNILWYKKSDSEDVKINVIRNSDQVFWTLGTVAAVEKVFTDIFGEGETSEWFNYGGDPYHFKMLTYNPDITESDVNEFLKTIKNVKRSSAIFDSVEIALSADYRLNCGFQLYTSDLITLTQEG